MLETQGEEGGNFYIKFSDRLEYKIKDSGLT